MSAAHDTADDDPYLWLEEVTGEAALDWVRQHNAVTLGELAGNERFEHLRSEARQVLDADDRIPFVARRGDFLYNFWQDSEHQRGLWRRTTLDQYRLARPEWEVLLDLDALAEQEGENWVWHGASALRLGGYRRALLQLSRGGADATVVREYDVERRAFVEGGFELPEAKSYVAWIDEDRIYVGTDFGPGSLTTSGYPRLVKEWRRGTDLASAELLFEAKPEDIVVGAGRDLTEGFERDFIERSVNFFHREVYVKAGDEFVRVPAPDDASVDAHRDWLTFQLRSTWEVSGASYPPGALLAARFDDYMAGGRELTVLFEPDEHTSLNYHAWTRDHLILGMLRDVRSELAVLTPPETGLTWRRDSLPDLPEFAQVDVVATDQYDSNEYMLLSASFTEPGTLRYGEIGGASEALKQAPAFFDAAGISVRQHFATSADGTAVPYFVVGPDEPQSGPAESGPTLLTGYGGFEISMTPSYSGIVGRGWLARGGTYVVANLRGGGEYGPDWHTNAIREHRHLVYEDFVAVAEDLVTKGITTPAQLGIMGGSNGGLLMGVMLTRHSELFGAIVVQVPLLDMRRYHELLAGASWMAEYGDPREEAEWEYMRPFSPYHNVSPNADYPPTLIITSTRDDRVHPGHARKMVARMTELGHTVTYYENIEGGHSAAADNEQLALRWALVLEFCWEKLGVRR